MEKIEEQKISFIGGGIIADVFIERMIKSGLIMPENIIVSDNKTERLVELKQRFGINTTQENSKCAEFGYIIFLAVPPGQIKIVLSEDCSNIISNEKIIISLAASIPTWVMETVLCKEIPVVRVIPNTPSLVGEGMNPYSIGKYVTEDQIKFVEALLSLFGKTIRIDETRMNLATSISAVGPTYFFPAIKALKDFAIAKGMTEEEAVKIISQTVSGTAELFKQTGKDPEELKIMIGTRTIDENGVKEIFAKAVTEAFSKVNQSTEKLTQ
ncbi:MAG: pyrroline-5-carboxylate reductase [Ignavibacteriales bacterium]|nr:pyrroline-5-carboxylate reductase [Ignavibacteriales bacterium]